MSEKGNGLYREGDFRWSILDCRNEFLVDGAIWLHAVRMGEVAASVSIRNEGGWAWVNNLFVRRDYRGFGLAKALLRRILAIAESELPDLPVGAGVRRNNVASMSLFKACGWGIEDEYKPGVLLMTPEIEVAASPAPASSREVGHG